MTALDSLIPDANGHKATVTAAVHTAVDSLLRVHRTTGIDLTQWEEMLPLILLVYPNVLIEGTGPTTGHTIHHAGGETGGWMREDPRKPGPGWIAAALSADPDHPSTVTHVDGARGTVVSWAEGSSVVLVDWHDAGVNICDEDDLTFTEGN